MSSRLIVPGYQGEIQFSSVEPLKPPEKGPTLPGGLWCLSPRSTIPFIDVKLSRGGWKRLTWGEALFIEQGNFGAVQSASYHKGDIVLTGLGEGSQPLARPAQITVPCTLTQGQDNTRGSDVDVRLARTIYLCRPNGFAYAGDYQVSVFARAESRGTAFTPGTQDASIGLTEHTYTVHSQQGQLPMGIGSGQWPMQDPPAAFLNGWYPMAALDVHYFQCSNAVASALSLFQRALFYVVEY